MLSFSPLCAGHMSPVTLTEERYLDSNWSSQTSVSANSSTIPLILLIHAGFRQASSPDVSLHNISLSSFLYSFNDQWKLPPHANADLQVYWSLDVQSFEPYPDALMQQVHNLQQLSLSFQKSHPFLQFHFLYDSGVASAYRRAVNLCESAWWCRYVFLLEEDWLFEHTTIVTPLADLIEILDQHTFMNYVRFNKFSNNFDGTIWDAPCLIRDLRILSETPFLKGAGFSNNPHIARASSMQILVEEVFDHDQISSEGLEHGSMKNRNNSPAAIYAMCAILSYDCIGETLFLEDQSSCDWRKHHDIEADVFERQQEWVATFARKGDDCYDSRDRRPSYDQCGLYVYGDWNDRQRISHLNGRSFSPATFWAEPRSLLTNDKLPYYT